ncbi:MAG: hypothetical protein LAT81_16195 [Oceanicaulis sp.]|nr:hypothetical protein [Oceanicaulis sp.]
MSDTIIASLITVFGTGLIVLSGGYLKLHLNVTELILDQQHDNKKKDDMKQDISEIKAMIYKIRDVLVSEGKIKD